MRRSVDLAGPSSNHLPPGLERDNLVLAEVTAREIGRVTIAEALELTALVARKQPDRYGRFAARWLCLYLEEHETTTLEDVALLVANLRSLASSREHAPALARLRKAVSALTPRMSLQPSLGGGLTLRIGRGENHRS